MRGAISSQNASRHVWFSGINNETQREYANNFVYNPVTGTLSVPRVEGTASISERSYTADKAGADGNGANIAATYAPKNGAGAYGTWGINIGGRAEVANVADRVGNDDASMRFHWNGQGGQPSWLWGGNSPHDAYVWNPSNFNVNYANTANSARSANTAERADSAVSAERAERANNAKNADRAEIARRAEKADRADEARRADTARKADNTGWADGAEYSNRAARVENDYRNMRFHWSGQGGQPSWLWGGNDGENMYVYNPSNFSVSRANTAGRADSAATADNANNLQGKDLNFLYRYLGGRNQPTLTPLLIRNSGWVNNNATGIHGQHSGDIQLRYDYRNFDAIFIVSTNIYHNCLMSHIWEKWRLEYLFNNGNELNILGTQWAYYWIWSAKQMGTSPHPLSTPTLWKVEDKAEGVICEIYGLNY